MAESEGMIRFEADSHTYWLGHNRIPSVTEILGAMTDLDGIRRMRPGVIERAADRGDAVHYGTELYDKGILDWSSVDDEQRPYIEAWVKFRNECDFVPELIEQRVYHPQLQYAGTLDRTGYMRGKRVLVDIKCVAAMYPTTGPQTAAYAQALHAEGHLKIEERYAVQLMRDGRYKLHAYPDAADFGVFIAMRTLIGWSDKHSQRILYDPAEKAS